MANLQLILMYKSQILGILLLVSEVTSSQNVNSSNNITDGGVDYDSGPYSTTFNAGGTSASFNVPITDDDVDETDENFNLAIDPSSLPPTCVMVGSPDTATVTIVDDEGE